VIPADFALGVLHRHIGSIAEDIVRRQRRELDTRDSENYLRGLLAGEAILSDRRDAIAVGLVLAFAAMSEPEGPVIVRRAA